MVHVIEDRLHMGGVLNVYGNHLTQDDFVVSSKYRFGAGRAERYARECMNAEAAKQGADIIFIEGIDHKKAAFGRYVCIMHGKFYRFKFIDE